MEEYQIAANLPQIDGYEVEGEIARGGMGVVYKAVQVRTGRPVAIKMILAAGRPSAAETIRFRLEAEAIASLDHPNIVQLLHPGEALGVPFHVLEYVGGGTLERCRDSSPGPPREAARLVETLAEAMAHAHGRGVVHRDLKPSNVLMTDDATPRPKIGDFGLARVLGAERSGLSQSRTFGTLDYMSPEQALGGSSLREIGPETDVWSLGVMLYERLVAAYPFRGKTDYDALSLICHAEPARPRTLRPEIPVDLESICLKCLEKDPRRRYGTARGLADDLGRFRRGEPVQARPTGRAGRAWKWCRRKPTAAALIVATAAGVGLAAINRYEAGRAELARARARGEVAAANADRATAEAAGKVAAAEAAAAGAMAEAIAYSNGIARALREFEAGHLAQAGRLLDGCPPGPRDWEWHHLRRRLDSDLVRIRVVPESMLGLGAKAIPALGFTPDGKGLILGLGRTLGLPEAVGGMPIRLDLEPPQGGPEIGAINPDGTLGAAFRPGMNAILLTKDGLRDVQRLFFGHAKAVTGMAFSPDGRRLASVSEDGTARTWLVDKGWEDARLALAGEGEVHDGTLAFSPDGKAVAILARRVGPGREESRQELTVWDLAEGRPRFPATAVGRPIGHAPFIFRDDWHRLAFSPESSGIAVASPDGTIRLIEAIGGREVGALAGHAGAVRALAFFPDGRRLASCGEDRTVRIWDLRPEGSPPVVMHAHREAAVALAIAPDGRRLASSDGLEIKVWDSARLQGFTTWRDRREDVRAVAFSPDGELMARGGFNADRSVRIQRIRTGEVVATLRHPTPAISAIAFRPDGKQIAVAAGVSAFLWDVAGEALLRTVGPHDGLLTDVAFAPGGKILATAGRGAGSLGRLRLWDPESGRAAIDPPIDVPGDPLLVFQPHGAELAVLGSKPSAGFGAWFFDPGSGRRLREEAGVRLLAFRDDGRRAAEYIQRTFDDGRVEVLDLATGKPASAIPEPLASLLAFRPSGSRLVTVGKRNLLAVVNAEPDQLTLWDATSGREALVLSGHAGYLVGIGFTPDGNQLVAAGADGTVYLWDGAPLPDAPGRNPGSRARERSDARSP